MSAHKDSAAVAQIQVGSFLPNNGGYYAGLLNVKGVTKAIIVSPEAQGEYEGQWSDFNKPIQGAACPIDGHQNTLDMIAAQTKLGLWVQSLHINGFADWHIPSQGELDGIYRAFNPAGQIQEFKESGAETINENSFYMFHAGWYWTSTQVANSSVWTKNFYDGGRGSSLKNYDNRARAIRTINVSDLTIQ